MILTGDQIKDAKIIKPFVERTVFEGMSFGKSLAGYDIRVREEIKLYPFRATGQFSLGSSIEAFNMPNDIVGLVKDKSSWARRGLSVFNTVIEPGWRGHLTLELVAFHGDLHIPAGSPIAQVLFFKTGGHTSGYSGKYQDQEARPIASRKETKT